MRSLIILALCALPAAAAISSSPVHTTSCDSTATTGCSQSTNVFTITIPSVAAGNTLIVKYGAGTLTTYIISTITGGATWSDAKTCHAQRVSEIWYAQNVTGGTTTITVTTAVTPSQWWFYVTEWSGMGTAGIDNAQTGCSSGTGALTQTSASVTTTNAGSLIVFADRVSSFYSSGPTSSFTGLALTNSQSFLAAYRIPGSPGTYSSSYTTTGTSTYDTAIAAFLPAPSGGFPAIY